MSDSPTFESPPTTFIDIINKINNIIKYFIIFSSSSSSSSSYTVTQWIAFECLFNPQNAGFTNYLLEHKAFTLNQITRGSGMPHHQCRYFIDKLVNANFLIASSLAQGYTKPHIIYSVKGEDPKYINEALKLSQDLKQNGNQLSLDNVDDWENLFINSLLQPTTTMARITNNLKMIKRVEIVQDYMGQHPERRGYDREAVARVIKKLETLEWEVTR